MRVPDAGARCCRTGRRPRIDRRRRFARHRLRRRRLRRRAAAVRARVPAEPHDVGAAGERAGRALPLRRRRPARLRRLVGAPPYRWTSTPTTSRSCSISCASSARWSSAARWAATSRSRSGGGIATASARSCSPTRARPPTPTRRAKRAQLIERRANGGDDGPRQRCRSPSMVGKTTRDKQPDTYDAVHRMMAQAPVEGIVGALEAMMTRPDSTPHARDDRRADADRRRRGGRARRRVEGGARDARSASPAAGSRSSRRPATCRTSSGRPRSITC